MGEFCVWVKTFAYLRSPICVNVVGLGCRRGQAVAALGLWALGAAHLHQSEVSIVVGDQSQVSILVMRPNRGQYAGNVTNER